MSEIPDWIRDWIAKDRLVRNKFKISRIYLRHSKRIQLVSGERNKDGDWDSFHCLVFSAKHGRYHVRFERGAYYCNCPFFKHRHICSHILGVCQKTKIWPDKHSIFSKK